jgi:aryl-phospho-beta-D-glucosidase BglC (GH1 family)
MSRSAAIQRWLVFWIGIIASLIHARSQTPAPLPEASWDRLPTWRGFNLQNQFHRDWSRRPFNAAEFQLISSLGFNFVRIPIDYRVYISGGNWTQFSESALQELDRAVSLGGQHGLHVCLNLHRIPGYTVASPAETRNLFTDPEAQRVAALHWRTLAQRYVGIPNRRLSFNLFNEPPDIPPAAYSNVVAQLCAAIRSVDPGRLIIADGLNYGRTPVPELIPLQVAQATRGYSPFGLTHYQASWVSGSSNWALPEWPSPQVPIYLFGPQKPEFRSTLTVQTSLSRDTRLRVRVGQVSARSRLMVRADGTQVLNRLFVPGPGAGEWKEVVYQPQWNIYQNLYDRDYVTSLPAGTTQVTVSNTEGDWMTFTELGFLPEGAAAEAVLRPSVSDWGARQTTVVTYRPGETGSAFRYSQSLDRTWLFRETIQPWIALRDRGVGVMVGEWGSHNQTPHPVTLAWMRDCLVNFQQAGLGWALWNFGGSFGPVDSERRDVVYESWNGRRLDRSMMDLLREFAGQRESYPEWRDRRMPASPGADLRREPGDDFNGDGVSNGFCYATGLDPTVSSPAELPYLAPSGSGEWTFHYRVSRREIGSRFVIEHSRDLELWRPLEGGDRRSERTAEDHEWWAVGVPGETAAGFVRLRVELSR